MPRAIAEWYLGVRRRSEAIFRIAAEDTYYERPIPLRHPLVFYEGHLPAFAVNTIIKLGLQEHGIDEALEVLFARGIDPDSIDHASSETRHWPTRGEVAVYVAAADGAVTRALANPALYGGTSRPTLNGEAGFTSIEHELMHQETLLYLLHQLEYPRKLRRPPLQSVSAATPAQRVYRSETVYVPRGVAILGKAEWQDGFGWDNESPAVEVDVAGFGVDATNVTNGEYLNFVEAGGDPSHFWRWRDSQWFWRGMFDLIPLPTDWPVYVTQAQAQAYAMWTGKRLMTEAEYHRAAFGTPSGAVRPYPWGGDMPNERHGNFGFTAWDPLPVGSFPDGASEWGVHDLVGNGWEWTSTVFDGFPGFRPMASYPEYSADFFDGQHYVMKGASPATARELIRATFRNWFRPDYPYVYAAFRCVSS